MAERSHPALGDPPDVAPYASSTITLGVRGRGAETYVFVITEPGAVLMDSTRAYELADAIRDVAAQARIRESSSGCDVVDPITIAT